MFHPKRLILVITTDCNLSCDYCYTKRICKDMDFATIKKAINLFLKISSSSPHEPTTIRFFGGEPLLRVDLIEKTIEYCKSRYPQFSFNFTVSTNGTIMSNSIAALLKKHHIDYRLSMDGSQETHDSCRKFADGLGTFKRIMNNLKTLKSNGIKPFIRVTCHPKNTANLHKDVLFFKENGFTDIEIVPAYGIEWNTEQIQEWQKQLRLIKDFYYKELANKTGFRICFFDSYLESFAAGNFRQMLSCALGEVLTVSPEGGLFACDSYLYRPDKENFILGTTETGLNKNRIKEFFSTNPCEIRDSKKCSICNVKKCIKNCMAFNHSKGRYEGNSFIENNLRLFDAMYNVSKELFESIDKESKIEELTLFLTKRCNLNCDYCYVEKKNEDMSEETAFTAIGHYFSSLRGKKAQIHFFGGEPLLNFALMKKIISHVEKNYPAFEVRYLLTTNGTLLDPGKINFFKEKEVCIIISLDGAKQTHENHRKKGSFDIVMKNIKECLKKSLAPKISMTVCPSESGKLKENVMQINKTGITDIAISPALSVFWSEQDLDNLRKSLEELAAWYFEKSKDIRISPFEEIMQNKNIRFDTCGLERYMVVDCDGSYYPCQICLVNPKKYCIGSTKKGITRKWEGNKKICLTLDARKGYELPPQEISKNRQMQKMFFEAVRKKNNSENKTSRNNSAFVNVNFVCNSNCISCIREKTAWSAPSPDFNHIKKRIDSIVSSSGHIGFNGGEPTLRKDIFGIINYAARKKKNMEIALLSNCRVFYNLSYVNKLKKSVLDNNFKIVTTIYGHSPKIHDTITRTPGSFKQQISGIKNLLKSGFKVELRIVINKINAEHIPKIAEYVSSAFNPSDFISVAFINQKIYGIAKDNYAFAGYKVKDIINELDSASQILIKNNFNLALYHFPHCILPKKLWGFSVGKSAEDSELVFPDFCRTCQRKDECSGIWKGYYDIEGASEFKPIK